MRQGGAVLLWIALLKYRQTDRIADFNNIDMSTGSSVDVEYVCERLDDTWYAIVKTIKTTKQSAVMCRH